jgi:hypothetical protein
VSARLKLYTTFHLNLAYSSIEEEQRPEVVRRCYWPLLRLARELDLPLGIEAPAYTLEAAAKADPAWLAELRALTTTGRCEFIGAGYAQVIAPLVPSEVNAANLALGQERCEELLGFRPTVGLVNEQAYSAGLPGLYRDAGFEAVVMEWDNPASTHAEWDREWRYLPQIALGQHGEEITLLWNKSLAFQKIQRYVHGEIELSEYLDYLVGHVANDKTRAFNLYGNDVEIFDFRPGRFATEASLEDGVEWERIGSLMRALLADERFEFVTPSDVLDLMDAPGAGNRLHLESAEQPVPVKKQGKYNLTRWAVTPRDDLYANTQCWRAYECLRDADNTSPEQWKELCYLWSSDFRTHITEKRWAAYRERLDVFVGSLERAGDEGADAEAIAANPSVAARSSTTEREGRFLLVDNEHVHLSLNTRRGLTIHALTFKALSDVPLIGTLEHGYYEDIALAADYYSGHFIFEPPGSAKVTDLQPAEPEIIWDDCSVEIAATIQTPIGPLRKRIIVAETEPSIEIVYEFDWGPVPLGSFRLGHVTLLPKAFERDTLFYATQNGGYELERFDLAGSRVDQGAPVSTLITASGGVGVTNGIVEIGDAHKSIRVEVDKTAAALIGLMSFREVDDSYFCRLAFSAMELDETGRMASQMTLPTVARVRLRGGPIRLNSNEAYSC